ncbi:MAG: nuclear transport factor 2 family protein, partial [Bacteroidetes bacterium]|nr:nuclear transport factor 2 family protein [Bacteroidota bacterium]
MKESAIKKIIQQFIKAANAFDVDKALTLFATNAIIDDVSVGKQFKNTKGVRDYLDQFFVGYHTVTKLVSLEITDNQHAK